jgi:hypothetical protein
MWRALGAYGHKVVKLSKAIYAHRGYAEQRVMLCQFACVSLNKS